MNSPQVTISNRTEFSAVALAQTLVRINTAGGNEATAAEVVADRLAMLGVAAEHCVLAPGRNSLIARLSAVHDAPAICFCGHLDTVPVGAADWAFDPLSGDIDGDRLLGRGSTDMKGGVAALVTAFERLAVTGCQSNVVLVLCASEETGCQGAAQIADRLDKVGAIVIAEPTLGQVAIAHKGALWLRLSAIGKAAHGSTPYLGVNAIDRLLDALVALRALRFEVQADSLLGSPTRNLGSIHGGLATNIVPDHCECTIDIRLTPGLSVDDAKAAVIACVGRDIAVETVLALETVSSTVSDPWIAAVIDRAAEIEGKPSTPRSVSYFTDASILQSALGNPLVTIVGPGEPSLAHQTNETCSVAAIERASRLYEALAHDWSRYSIAKASPS